MVGPSALSRSAEMSHPNAVLTPRHRMKVARLVVDDGWPISEVAARFQVYSRWRRLALRRSPSRGEASRRDTGQVTQRLRRPDQRQSRALPPHHGRRLGLRPLLHQRETTPRRSAAVAAPLQPAPPTHRLRQPAAVLTVNQRPRSVHLGGDLPTPAGSDLSTRGAKTGGISGAELDVSPQADRSLQCRPPAHSPPR